MNGVFNRFYFDVTAQTDLSYTPLNYTIFTPIFLLSDRFTRTPIIYFF